MAKSAKEKMKEYREKLKKDPQRYEEYLAKARARKKKNYVPVEQLNRREKANRRSKTKEYVRQHRVKKMNELHNSITEVESESGYETRESAGPLVVNMPFPNRKNGPRKRISNALAKKHRQYNDLKMKFQNLEKKYKSKLRYIQRLNKAKRSEVEKPKEIQMDDMNQTPNSKTKQMMANVEMTPIQRAKLKKQLLFANIVQAEIKKCQSGNKRDSVGALRGLVGGRILRKYKLIRTANKLTGLGRNKITKVAGLSNFEKRKRDREVERYRSSVMEFLMREDNSRCNPGKQDKLKVNKHTYQTRILTDYLKNLHSKFLSENPNAKLSLASFCRVRPAYIKLTRFISRTSCLCTKHQNLALCVKAMKKLDIPVPLNPEKFVEDESNIEKMKSNAPDEITFGQWKRVAVEDKGKTKMVMKIVSSNMTKSDFLKYMEVQIEEFREHIYRVRRQYEACQNIKKNLPEDEVVVIMDFAENYTCKSVEEIQSAYWNKSAVTLHPVVIYFKKDIVGDLQHKGIVIISDELGHNSATVLKFIDHVIPEVKKCVPSVTKVHYFTDSPTSQYRNKTIFNMIANHQEIYGCNAIWNYYEAGHGKGPCDGLGGTTKRMADDAVNSGKATIQDGMEFFNWTQSSNCSMNTVAFLYVASVECAEKSQELNMYDIKPVKGTMKIHAVIGKGNNQIVKSSVSCYCEECILSQQCGSNNWVNDTVLVFKKQNIDVDNSLERNVNQPEEATEHLSDSFTELSIEVGNFVAARYDRRLYIGRVIDMDEEDGDIEITFMENLRKLLQWPKHEDKIWVDRKDVVCTISEPIPTGKSKRMFKLSEDDLVKLENSM